MALYASAAFLARLLNHLVNEPALNVDSTRKGTCKVSHEGFVGRRVGEWVFPHHIDESFCFLIKPGGLELFGIYTSR